MLPEGKTVRCYRLFKAADYLVNHQIASGLSLGIFDKEYQFKRPESAATGGKLYWDESDESADQDKLAEQMDFPLISVALAYDGFNHLDPAQIAPLIETLPAFGVLYQVLAERDPRDAKSWEATATGQVLLRNATATMVGYEGHGFMALLARYMMRKAAAEGFRGIQIECGHPAVNHVWSNPPEPFKGEIVSKIDLYNYEHKDDKGEVEYIFRPSKIDATKVYVTLTS
jgi:hypothetical protein